MRVDGVYFITFRSVTYAQRGERILSRAGFRCSIRRTQRWMAEMGCGYSLRVQTLQIEQAVGLLRAEQLPIGKVYWQREEGKLEETAL